MRMSNMCDIIDVVIKVLIEVLCFFSVNRCQPNNGENCILESGLRLVMLRQFLVSGGRVEGSSKDGDSSKDGIKWYKDV